MDEGAQAMNSSSDGLIGFLRKRGQVLYCHICLFARSIPTPCASQFYNRSTLFTQILGHSSELPHHYHDFRHQHGWLWTLTDYPEYLRNIYGVKGFCEWLFYGCLHDDAVIVI